MTILPRAGSRVAVASLALVMTAPAQQATRPVIHTEADLPSYKIPVSGDPDHLLTEPTAAFLPIAGQVVSDIDTILRGMDVEDHAAHRILLETKGGFDIIAGGHDQEALALIQQIRALQDKPDAKLTDDLSEEAFLRARMSSPTPAGSCPAGYQPLYARLTNDLPWNVVGRNTRERAGFLALENLPFLQGELETDLGPSLAKEHALSLSQAETLVYLREQALLALPCKEPSLSVLNAYVSKNDVVKPEIWHTREVTLTAEQELTPVVVGIWDSGFDTSLFPGRLYNSPDPSNSDPHGIAFDVHSRPTHGELMPLTAQQQKDYPGLMADMQAISDLMTGVSSPAASNFQQKLAAMSAAEVHRFFDEAQILGGYAHGTHVAGIAARGNPAIRLAYGRVTYDEANPHMPPTDQLLQDTAVSYAATVRWFQDHQVRVVNMSWWDRPSNFEKDLADNGIGTDAADRKRLARHFFEIERDALFAALKSAPDILFVTIAGNSDANNAFEEDIPSSFQLPNLIVTGAVDKAGDETSFTSYGDNVLVDADGYEVESVVPGGARVKMSGTSMAAPQVTNLAAKLLALDPSLKPTELVALIRDGADASADGRRHLLNPARSVHLLQARANLPEDASPTINR